MHNVEKGVPMPPPTKGIYPFGSMEVGDSFEAKATRGAVSAAASDYGKRHGLKFSVRQIDGTIRVWRIA